MDLKNQVLRVRISKSNMFCSNSVATNLPTTVKMMTFRKYILALILITTLASCGQLKPVPNSVATVPTTSPMDRFISDLLSKMTVEEKIGQLNLLTGGEAITRSTTNTELERKVRTGQDG